MSDQIVRARRTLARIRPSKVVITLILAMLGGCVRIRVKRERDSLTGKLHWIDHNVSPSLACVRKVFRSDHVFLRWLFDVLDEGDDRMNKFSRRIAEDHEAVLDYRNGNLLTNAGVPYECHVS